MGVLSFDTGLALAQRTTIRAALVARLAPLLKANGKYLRAVKVLPRPVRSESDENGLSLLGDALRGQAPAVAIALGRKTYEGADLDAYVSRGELEVAVYVVSGNQRGHVEGRLATDAVADADATADPGIEAMLEHVEELLLGQEIGVAGVSELRPVEEDEAATFDDFTVWEQRYTVQVERAINPLRNAQTTITSLQGNHKLDGIEADSALDPLVTAIVDPLPQED